jgi:hypothetical protein
MSSERVDVADGWSSARRCRGWVSSGGVGVASRASTAQDIESTAQGMKMLRTYAQDVYKEAPLEAYRGVREPSAMNAAALSGAPNGAPKPDRSLIFASFSLVGTRSKLGATVGQARLTT